MRFRITIVFLVLACAWACPGDEAEEVKAAWDKFVSASVKGDGEGAADVVSGATIAYYQKVRDLALAAGRDELAKQPLGMQVTVLGTRMRIEPGELQEMNGRDLFVHSIHEGWIGKDAAEGDGAGETVTDVQMEGDSASAVEAVANQTTDHRVHFIREEEKWKFDMMPTIAVVDKAFEQMQAESKLAREEYVARVVEAVTGERPVEKDWVAPLPEAPKTDDPVFADEKQSSRLPYRIHSGRVTKSKSPDDP